MRLPQSSLRNTLLLSHLGLVLLTMILVGLYVLDQMQGFYLQQLRQNLVVESTMVAAAAAEALSTTDLGPLREMMAAVDREGAVRIRVFDAAGRLIAATEVEDAPLVGEPLVATGLAAALRGERTTMLTNDAPGPEIMYLADPVVVDGQVRGAVRLAYALVDVSNEVATLRGALLVGLAGAGVGAAVLAVLLAGSLAAPARRLALAAQELAAGNLTTRCDATGSSEIAAAARAFDAMASRLQALQSARQELMATVAHDLNATTMAQGMAVEALEHGAVDDPQFRSELLHGIGGHTRRLTRLAADLLQSAQLEAGGLHLEREVLAPSALLRQTAAEFLAEAAARRVALAVELTEPLSFIEGDPARLGQALANLVENALRHAPPGSTVHLRASSAGGVVVLAVADEGPGFPGAAPAQCWEPSANGGSPHTSLGVRPGRLGLGLSIVRGIVEAHGGTLEITSAPGAGACFALMLPALPDSGPE